MCMESPELVREWYEVSNNIVIVSVADEDELLALADRAHIQDIPYDLFREWDLGDQATAIAFEPGKEAATLCATLPLALREVTLV